MGAHTAPGWLAATHRELHSYHVTRIFMHLFMEGPVSAVSNLGNCSTCMRRDAQKSADCVSDSERCRLSLKTVADGRVVVESSSASVPDVQRCKLLVFSLFGMHQR